MFKRFQQGGMMPPQGSPLSPQPQGQMMPPDPQQMMQQGQGGAQLPDEVIQLLMTLPENIRQYLLSLPEDKMMMELQKIMQEKMAQQQGPPMPPQGGEQMAPPMMGKYGMKLKAQSGASYSKQALKLPKVQEEIGKQLTTKKPEPIVQQPIVNPNAPKLGQKVMLGGKEAVIIDAGNGQLAFRLNDGTTQMVRMAQTTPTLPQGAINVGSINDNETVTNTNQVQSRKLTTTPSGVTTKSAAPKVVTTKPAQIKSSPATGQQGIITNPTKQTTPSAKSKVTTSPNNTQWTDKQLNDEFMKGNIANPVTITAPKYLRDIVPYSPEYSDSNPNNDNTRFNSKQHELANLNNKIAILKDEEKKFLKAKRNGAGMISWKDSMEHKKITDKIDALYTERNKVEKSKKSYSAYKSGGQLPSALKISTPLKTIMDRKIEMYKSGGKMKLKTCKHGC